MTMLHWCKDRCSTCNSGSGILILKWASITVFFSSMHTSNIAIFSREKGSGDIQKQNWKFIACRIHELLLSFLVFYSDTDWSEIFKYIYSLTAWHVDDVPRAVNIVIFFYKKENLIIVHNSSRFIAIIWDGDWSLYLNSSTNWWAVFVLLLTSGHGKDRARVASVHAGRAAIPWPRPLHKTFR